MIWQRGQELAAQTALDLDDRDVGDDALRERINQAGDISFLPKPFSLKQLVVRVKEVMSAPAPVP